MFYYYLNESNFIFFQKQNDVEINNKHAITFAAGEREKIPVKKKKLKKNEPRFISAFTLHNQSSLNINKIIQRALRQFTKCQKEQGSIYNTGLRSYIQIIQIGPSLKNKF